MVGREDVAWFVREFAAGEKNGDVGAVAGGSAAIAAKGNCLELAIGTNSLHEIVVAAVTKARNSEEDEHSDPANREHTKTADYKTRPEPRASWLARFHGTREEAPNGSELSCVPEPYKSVPRKAKCPAPARQLE